ncbi:MAG: hypothetical protein UMS36scaffold28_71 [Phage 59_13]|nr:MAG: hypothetical protein UMS36scaffold28_71 [Phage 59_13]
MSSRIEVLFSHNNIPAWRTQISVADEYARRVNDRELAAIADAVAQVVVAILIRPDASIEKTVPKVADQKYNAGKKKH